MRRLALDLRQESGERAFGTRYGERRCWWLLLFVVAHQAAINHVGRPRDVGGIVGCEEGDEAGDLLRFSHAAKWDVVQKRIEFLLIVEELLVDGSDDRAGRDVVDSDVVWAE